MASSSDAESGPLIRLRARLRLLQSLASRGSSEIAALLIPPALLWISTRISPEVSHRLALWWGVMVIMALGLMLFRRSLHRRWQQARDWSPQQLEAALPVWQRQLALAALINGLLWSSVLGFTWGDSHTELRMLVFLVLAGVMASAATFLAPVLPVFTAFMAGIYLPMLLATLDYFPNKGVYLLPLLLLYGAILGRHAWGARRFVQQQMAHELERQALAERYREAQIQAETALAEKNWFVSAASHDLRQPLHAMGLMLEAAHQRNQDAQVLQLLQEMQACTRDLGSMFNDLMDLSRLEGDSFAPQWQAVNMTTVLDEAQRLFAREASQRGLRLHMHLPPHVPVLRADAVLLRQMVFNLLQNALRYTDKGGVLLALRRKQGRWLLQVWDSGSGMTAQECEWVFVRHYRSPVSQQREASAAVPAPLRGRGLGLSVVALAAQRLGVEYGVNSIPGKGSCFWLHWPSSAEQIASEPVSVPALQPTSSPASGSALLANLQGRCLLVESDALAAAVLETLLQSWGVQVRKAQDLAQAQQMACDEAPDFVLCGQLADGASSGLDGLMQLLDQCPAASGALLSDDDALLEQAQDQGYLTLTRPLQPEQLHAVLARCMAGSVREVGH
ncbi:hybrid sensor histidine kinase/response regulator [Comamonas testosteroni]|uniref:histidine kinase n=1 Tax=Comamonas testosteroni TaxID=285 RepID=A0A373FI02_COMTE|nr:hybrid sensor histidine kinase/response regulator [Comamonas testosteroni]RGE43788.1 hybrid sensor histidine kinase/response regulator [Comamonas testosteroni]